MMKTAKDLELSLLLKEKKIQDLQLELQRVQSLAKEYSTRIINTKYYIRENINFRLSDKFIEEIYDILEGVNKE